MKASSLPRIFLLSPLWYLLKVLEGSHLLFVLPCWDPHLWLHYKTRCHLLLYVYWFDLVSRALEMVQPTEISTCNMWQHTVTDKLIKMVNFFKLGNEMWRWINQHDTSVGQRKILSPRIFINLSLLTMNSIALILAVCRTPIIYELS